MGTLKNHSRRKYNQVMLSIVPHNISLHTGMLIHTETWCVCIPTSILVDKREKSSKSFKVCKLMANTDLMS